MSTMSSFSNLALFEPVGTLTPIPMPLASRTSMATLAAPSEVFLVRARVLRRAPKACALMTARVPDIGGVLGEGEREDRDGAVPRRGRTRDGCAYGVVSPSLLPARSGWEPVSLPDICGKAGKRARSGPEFALRGPRR